MVDSGSCFCVVPVDTNPPETVALQISSMTLCMYKCNPGIMWGEPAVCERRHNLCVMRQYSAHSRKLDLSLFSCSLYIQASVDSLSRWLALITSLRPALSLSVR